MFDQNQPTQSAPVVPEPATTTDSSAMSATDTSSYNTSAVTPEPVTETTPAAPVEPTETTTSTAAPAEEPTTSSTPAGDESLLSIKKDALQNLTPLLSQLDQSPDEKFRTTMMLIQASDDKSLIQSAYDAAKDIEDEKVRAQALLDIVNEINYFTQDKEEE